MPDNRPFASILVRAHNDGLFIERALHGIFAQKVEFPFEVVVCDDASTDDTRAIAARFPVRFVDRPDGPYKPGRTLNALVREARGDVVVFNNADAVPLDENWLAELVRPLVGSRVPVFSFANQLPRANAQALVRKDSERAFGDGKVQAKWRFFFSLASSATWRQSLLDVPFDESIQYSEDVEWTWRNSRRETDPVSVVYCPDAHVEHSHNYTLKELARRFRGEGAADAQIFGDRPCLPRELVGAVRETLRDWAYLAPRPKGWLEIPIAPIRRLVQRIAHWRGMCEEGISRAEHVERIEKLKATTCSTRSTRPRILVYLEKAEVRGGIEVFAERHVAKLRDAGHEVDVWHELPISDGRRETADARGMPFGTYDEIIVHKCTDVATLERFPPEKTTYYVHDHEPICPRTYAYTPFRRNCSRSSGVWPCLFCAPLCRSWKAALFRVFAQGRRKRAMARFKRIVVISEFMKGRLVANGLPSEKIAVEPPPIVTPPPPSLSTFHPSPFTIHSSIDLLYVGQLIRGKGVQLLLEAMAHMSSPRTLDVVGTGNMEAKLKAQATRLGLAERVRWRGFQANPFDWMRAAKCVVVPSFWQEPYGLVAAEAVALGKRVVAFAVGGLPEACHGKATLVPPGDVDALASTLDDQLSGGTGT